MTENIAIPHKWVAIIDLHLQLWLPSQVSHMRPIVHGCIFLDFRFNAKNCCYGVCDQNFILYFIYL